MTKSTEDHKFQEVNVDLTHRLISSIKNSGILGDGTFAYVSSQAALGPVLPGGPVSRYGASKLLAEELIKTSGLNYTIFRPTGIYGPRDKEFLALFKTAKFRLYLCAAPENQKITLIHVEDVARNIIELSMLHTNEIIHLSDNKVYSHRDLQRALAEAIGKKSLFLKIPMGMTRTILKFDFLLGKLFGYDPILTVEKHGEISKDWDHDFSLERNKIPLKIQYDLFQGFSQTFTYYKSKNLL